MQHQYISTPEQLIEFCDSISHVQSVAFDTEFVSEDTYRPYLCLIQVAAEGRLAVIDTVAVPNVDAFWELLAQPGRETIVHAGREEFRFCRQAIGQGPARLFDIQIAAGLIGLEYPAAYRTLVYKLLGISLPKGETRTNWRRRPLSSHQLDYALQDVVHLERLRDILGGRIDELRRGDWLESELAAWQAQIIEADTRERWRRVSGIAGLSSRQLAIVRELWRWRDSEAERRDCPPKRVLRDDLVVELARRQQASVRRIRALRGMEQGRVQRDLPAIARCIATALALDDRDCPGRITQTERPQLSLLAQFLYVALGSICRRANVAASIVGTSQDIRDLIAFQLGLESRQAGDLPLLATGWRAEVVGRVIDELLHGKLAIRITNPLSDQPLEFQPTDTSPES